MTKLFHLKTFIQIFCGVIILLFSVFSLNARADFPIGEIVTVQGKQYKYIRMIGEGSEGRVYEVQLMSNPQVRFALKKSIIRNYVPGRIPTPDDIANMAKLENHFELVKHRARQIQQQVGNKLPLLPIAFDYVEEGPYELNPKIYSPDSLITYGLAIMPLADLSLHDDIVRINNDVDSRIDQNQFRRFSSAWRVFQDLLEEIKVLSAMSYVHLDIKPPNIVFDRKLNKFSLIDFGSIFSTLKGEDEERVLLATSKYAAKEVFNGRYSELSSLYALAITTLEVLDAKFELNHKPGFVQDKVFTYNSKKIDELELYYLRSFASIDRDQIKNLFSFIRAATTKDPAERLLQLSVLDNNQDLKDIIGKVKLKQSRTSQIFGSIKDMLNHGRSMNLKNKCEMLFQQAL